MRFLSDFYANREDGMKKIFKSTFIFLLGLATLGAVYHFYSGHLDGKSYPVRGQLVDIGGYELHAELLGQGNITVVFDAGMGDSALAWHKVAKEVSKVARVLLYDRAGLGKSDVSPLVRSSTNIVNELNSLLEELKIEGPIILVGHSFGGLNMQLFAQRHLDKVAGLVLVDSASMNQLDKLPTSSLLRSSLLKLGMLAAPVGVPRLYLSLDNPEEHAEKSTVKHQYTTLDEANGFKKSTAEVKSEHINLKNLPVAIISRNYPSKDLQGRRDASNRNVIWASLQEELLKLSTKSSIIHTHNRHHTIHRNQPQLVVDVILAMVDGITK